MQQVCGRGAMKNGDDSLTQDCDLILCGKVIEWCDDGIVHGIGDRYQMMF